MPGTEDLRATLSALQRAARHGDLAELGRLSPRLEAQLAALLADPPEEEAQLLALRAAASEAEALLEATLRGVSAARARLAEIREIRSGSGTYGGDGQRRRLTLPTRDGKRL